MTVAVSVVFGSVVWRRSEKWVKRSMVVRRIVRKSRG
jgi:hypothetical protein